MSLEAPFAVGDFVEIKESHEKEAGKRGYILRPYHDQDGDVDASILDVTIDEARFDPPPNETRFSSQTPARVVMVPAQDLKLVRGHMERQEISMKDYMDEEYPCLGMAASSNKVSKINPESAHGRLERLPARDLPGPHSCDRTFASAEMEGLSRQLYDGDIVFQWYHTFVPPGDESQEMDTVALERAAPYVVAVAFPATMTENHSTLVELHLAGSNNAFSFFIPGTYALTPSQQHSWAMRAVHFFIAPLDATLERQASVSWSY